MSNTAPSLEHLPHGFLDDNLEPRPEIVHAITPIEDPNGIPITNKEFLMGLFRGHWWAAYVTGFPDDPSAITPDRRGFCWSGTHYSKANGELDVSNNTYFCISLFYTLAGRAVRRRAQFLATCVIVVDDVGTKVPRHVAARLPAPSYKLETSPGNEQWGWILDAPEVVMWRVEGLLNGLVAAGIAEDGNDPGMKGVTRLVRLPNGVNNKAKYVEQLGEPWRCRLTYWAPMQYSTVDALAEAFGIELVQPADTGQDKAGGVWPDDAPVMVWINEHLLEQKSDSEFLVECPWVHEHTDGDTSGTWIRTLDNGAGEFKCHHGHCENRGFNDFLVETGLRGAHDAWRAFRGVPAGVPAAAPIVNAVAAQVAAQPDGAQVDFMGPPGAHGEQDAQVDPGEDQVGHPGHPWDPWLDALPVDPTQDMPMLREIIARVAQLDRLEQGRAVQALKDRCRGFLQARVIDAEVQAASAAARAAARLGGDIGGILDGYIYIASKNKYFRRRDNTLMVPEAFDRHYANLEFWGEPGPLGDPIRLTATQAFDRRENKRVTAGLGWSPVEGDIVWLSGRSYANSYRPPSWTPRPGDVSLFLWLGEALFGKRLWRYLLLHMAFTVQHPGKKIRWQFFIYGKPRIGKTSIVYPLLRIFGDAAQSIRNKQLLGDWGDHFFQKKVIVIEEVLQTENRDQYNELKTRFANDEIEMLNLKGSGIVAQQNLYSMYLFSNYAEALHFEEDDDKLMVLEARDPFDGDKQAAKDFFRRYYDWVNSQEGTEALYDYLLNLDVTEFSYGALPERTEAYYKASQAGRPDYQRAIAEMEEEGRVPFDSPFVYFKVLKAALQAEGYRCGDRGIAAQLTAMGYERRRGQVKRDKVVSKTPWVWVKGFQSTADRDLYVAFEEHRRAQGV